MSIQVNNKNLGHATAYAYAVAGGYTGTEAEFIELLGNIADDLEQIENLTVTVETLAAGSSATASYSNGVLHLGIPKGDKGDKGDTGATGPTGPTGNGIASVAKTGTSGLVDTYTITYTNGNTSTFTVTNGAEAVDNTLTIAGRAADAKKTGDEISELKEDLTQTNDRLTDIDGSFYVAISDFELGTIYLESNHTLSYFYNIKRIRTKQSVSYYLKKDDVLAVSGTGVRFFMVIKHSGTWMDSGWKNSTYTMPYDAECKIVIGYNPEVEISDIDALLARFSITRDGVINELDKIPLLENRSMTASIINNENILLLKERLEYTATSSGTWQSGENFRINHVPCNANDVFYAFADDSNTYGSNLITFAFYASADRSGNPLWQSSISSASFNASHKYKLTVPSGASSATEVDIYGNLISGSFGDYVPSAGDVAFVDNLVIYKNGIALKPFVGIHAIDHMDQSTIYVLQDNWKSKIQDIQTAQNGKFSFAVQTDTHFGEIGTGIYVDQYIDLQNNLSKLTQYVGFDFICNLGDVVRGYGGDTTIKMLEAYTEIMHRYVANLTCPLLVTLGNHDTNLMYAEDENDPSLQITKGELYSKVMPFVKNSTHNAVFNGRSLYYYVDFDDSDIRVIMLNTTDGEFDAANFGSVYKFSQEQITWFTNVALNTDKSVLFMCHVPLVSDLTTNTVSGGTDVLNALKAFKNNGGHLIGCFYGHTHKQDDATVDGILHVTFTNGGNCTECVIIDTVNKTVNTVGVGKDLSNRDVIDRSFSYT